MGRVRSAQPREPVVAALTIALSMLDRCRCRHCRDAAARHQDVHADAPRTTSPTSTYCASRSATTTATRSAAARSRTTATTPRRRARWPPPGSAGSRRTGTHHARAPRRSSWTSTTPRWPTWNYEIFSNWAFNPTTNGQFVTEQRFPAVPGMVDLVQSGRARGLRDLLPDRPAAPRRRPATLGNLTADGVGVDAGYPTPTTLNNGEDGLFTKPAVADYPDYLKAACAERPERRLHHPPLQVGHPRPHRVARLRHRRQLRRPVQRPRGRARRPHVQDARTRTTSCRSFPNVTGAARHRPGGVFLFGRSSAAGYGGHRYHYGVHRTTIMLPTQTRDRLRRVAAQRGVSMGTLIREAIENVTIDQHPKPKSLGIGASGQTDIAPKSR